MQEQNLPFIWVNIRIILEITIVLEMTLFFVFGHLVDIETSQAVVKVAL